MKSKQREKDLELKCTCAECGRGATECACSQESGDSIELSEPIAQAAASASAAADSERSTGPAASAPNPSDTTLPSDASTAEVEGSSNPTASLNTAAFSNATETASAARISFPSPTPAALARWIFSATALCLIISMVIVLLYNWRAIPSWELALQSSYFWDNAGRSRLAIGPAKRALRLANLRHMPPEKVLPIYDQLYYLYSKVYDFPNASGTAEQAAALADQAKAYQTELKYLSQAAVLCPDESSRADQIYKHEAEVIRQHYPPGSQQEVDLLIQQAHHEQTKGMVGSALEYFQQALPLAEANHDRANAFRINLGAAYILNAQKKYSESLVYIEGAEKLVAYAPIYNRPDAFEVPTNAGWLNRLHIEALQGLGRVKEANIYRQQAHKRYTYTLRRQSP